MKTKRPARKAGNKTRGKSANLPAAKTILLTGAAGFIGSNVLEYLFSKYPAYRFLVLDVLTYAGQMKNIPENIRNSPRFSFWYGDVRNSKLVEALVSKSDVVLHFAAETHVTRSIDDNTKFFETDVLGTQCVANAVLTHEKTVDRFIHISTCEVYGEGLVKKMDESHPLNPHSPYAAAKAGADRLVYAYHKTYRIPSIILRPFNIFGPRQHLEKAVPRFVTSGILGESITVHGSGAYTRDYMYVEDLSRAIDILIHAPRKQVIGEVYNVGSGNAVSIIDLARSVLKHMKCPPRMLVHIGDRPGQVNNFACDYKKMKSQFGWEPRITFNEGIKKTVAWYRKNREIWKDQMWMRQVPIKTAKGKIELH